MTARIALYLTLGAIAFVALISFADRIEDGNEARERMAVQHAVRWHKSYVASRKEVHKLEVVAKKAVAKSEALRDSVTIISDSLVAIVTAGDTMAPRVDTVKVPQIVVRRLVADSVTISQLTQLVAVQGNALEVADSTIAAYQVALTAAQANKCRLFWVVPCPSRKTTALLTAGGLLVVKLTLGAAK